MSLQFCGPGAHQYLPGFFPILMQVGRHTRVQAGPHTHMYCCPSLGPQRQDDRIVVVRLADEPMFSPSPLLADAVAGAILRAP